MKNKKDEYVVYTNPITKADFYYKNKQLHRELGPAIVINEEKSKYSTLSDKNLYKPVTKPVVPDKMITEIIIGFKNEIEYITRPWKPYSSTYYLEDIQYKKEHWEALILEKELSKTTQNTQSKKLKI